MTAYRRRTLSGDAVWMDAADGATATYGSLVSLPPPLPPYTPPVQTPRRRPWWRRWWVLTVVAVIVLGAIGSASSKKKGGTAASKVTSGAVPTASTGRSAARSAQVTTGLAPTSTLALTTTSTLVPTTTSTLASTTTSTLAPPPTTMPTPVVYDGRGDDVVDLSYPEPTKIAALHAVHQGRSNFIVHGLTNGESTGGLVNEIGSYDGTVLLESADQLEIKADGPWHIELLPLLSLPSFDKHADGRGDQVLIYSGPRSVLALTHDGTSNFIVHAFTKGRSSGLVNEIGAYSGKVPLSAGPGFIEIHADGNWTLDVG